MLVRKRDMLDFLARQLEPYKANRLYNHMAPLIPKLAGRFRTTQKTIFQELLLQQCQNALSPTTKFEFDAQKDLDLGYAAVNAVLLNDAPLFSATVLHLKQSFGLRCYQELGAVLCLEDLKIEEDE